MVHWILLSVTMLSFLLTSAVVLMVRRRELQKSLSIPTLDRDPVASFEVDDDNAESFPATNSDETAINAASTSEMQPQPTEILSLSILARPKENFVGYELLQSLLSNNLRFGKYQIFHYFELDKSIFSLASATKPGTFDMDAMGGYSTPGLTLFMELNDDPHLEAIFDKMLQVANNIAKDLNGYLVDAKREPLNDSGIHAMRTHVRQFHRNLELEHESP